MNERLDETVNGALQRTVSIFYSEEKEVLKRGAFENS